MLDREYVNRFLAFYLLDQGTYQDLDTFLNNALHLIAKTNQTERETIRNTFYDTLDTINECFGKYAFCKLDDYPRMKPINRVLFEVLTVSVAKLTGDERSILRKKQCLEPYVALFNEEKGGKLTGLVSVSTSDKSRINQRYEIVETFLRSVIHA